MTTRWPSLLLTLSDSISRPFLEITSRLVAEDEYSQKQMSGEGHPATSMPPFGVGSRLDQLALHEQEGPHWMAERQM
jgi:hypothetical protein